MSDMLVGERPTLRAGFVAGSEQSNVAKKFVRLQDFGQVVMPAGWTSGELLKKFWVQYGADFHLYDGSLRDDGNFLHPEENLIPGRKFNVEAFTHDSVMCETTTSADRRAFLREQRAVNLGPQGLVLLWVQCRHALANGYWYTSFEHD